MATLQKTQSTQHRRECKFLRELLCFMALNWVTYCRVRKMVLVIRQFNIVNSVNKHIIRNAWSAFPFYFCWKVCALPDSCAHCSSSVWKDSWCHRLASWQGVTIYIDARNTPLRRNKSDNCTYDIEVHSTISLFLLFKQNRKALPPLFQDICLENFLLKAAKAADWSSVVWEERSLWHGKKYLPVHNQLQLELLNGKRR